MGRRQAQTSPPAGPSFPEAEPTGLRSQRLQGRIKDLVAFLPKVWLHFSFSLLFFFFKEKCSCARTPRLLQEAAVGEAGKQAKKQERKRPRLAWQIPNGPGDLRLCSGRPWGLAPVGGKGRPKDSHLLAGDLGRDAACCLLPSGENGEEGDRDRAGQLRSQEGPFQPETRSRDVGPANLQRPWASRDEKLPVPSFRTPEAPLPQT